VPTAQLTELAAQVRGHVEQTREVTASLRRAMDQQQRQYNSSLGEFQRKLAEASRKKGPTGSQRIEISPDSMQVLRSLVLPPGSGEGAGDSVAGSSAGGTAASGEALQHWFGQVDRGLRRLLRSAASKLEARRCLQTVSMVVHNLVESPAEDKYREVNAASARFRGTLGSPESGAAELLQLAGFEPRGQCFVFPQDRSLDEAERVRDFLQAALRDSDSRWEQACDDTVAEPCEAASMGETQPPSGGGETAILSSGSNGVCVPGGALAGSHRAAPGAAAGGAVAAEDSQDMPVSGPAGVVPTAGGGSSQAASGGAGTLDAAKAQPWQSSVSQKRLAPRPPVQAAGAARGSGTSSGSGSIAPVVEELPVGGSDASTLAGGPALAARPHDAGVRPAGAQTTQAPAAQTTAAHPAEALGNSQEPQSGG